MGKMETGGLEMGHVIWLICGAYLTFAAVAAAKSLQWCPTLCDSTDGSPPGSPIPGILKARTLEWVAMLAYEMTAIVW